MRRLLAVWGAMLILGGSPARLGAEPAEPPHPIGDPIAVPVVTLDALPLSVPTAALPPSARALVESVLAGSIFGQRVTGIRYPSREAVFRFLLDHPDFAASVARALRLGEYRVTPREDGYWGDDNRGARGMIRVLYADDERRLYHLEGRYERGLLPAIEGQLLVLLEFRHDEDSDGGSVVESSLTAHLRLDSPVAGLVAQTVGALTRPLVERAVERKVRRFFATVARVSRWAHDQPAELAAALDGHPEVSQRATLAAFRAILLAGRLPAWAQQPLRLLDTDLASPDLAEPVSSD